jgi:hypothetical protein
MSAFPIGNLHNPPLNNINGSLVNTDGSSVGGIPFANNKIPTGIHTLPPAGSNIQGAASIYPASSGQKGGKINRRKINKISRKYKMKGSKRTIKRRVRRIKGRVLKRYSKRRSSSRRASKSRYMRGGAFQPPQVTPNYPAGYSQFNNNNGSLSNTYSLGGPLAASSSALANPPPFTKVAGDPDNLKHDTLNAYGNIGAGSGFPSRGWF